MQAIVFDDFGEAKVFRPAEVSLPILRRDDTLVGVMAAGRQPRRHPPGRGRLRQPIIRRQLCSEAGSRRRSRGCQRPGAIVRDRHLSPTEKMSRTKLRPLSGANRSCLRRSRRRRSVRDPSTQCLCVWIGDLIELSTLGRRSDVARWRIVNSSPGPPKLASRRKADAFGDVFHIES